MACSVPRLLSVVLLLSACSSGDAVTSFANPTTLPPNTSETTSASATDPTEAPATTGTPTTGAADPSTTGDVTDLTGEPITTTSSTKLTEGTGEMCVPGTEFCPCDGAACMDGLSCVDDVCQPYACGNGIPEPGEPCDDGNDDFTDACTPGCKAAVCGDGALQAGVEECDLGPANSDTGACRSNCKLQACGDGFVGPGESCDDGNQVNDDPCSNTCAPAGCGDGIPQGGEQCDDGNANTNDACLSSCVIASCGDGQLYNGNEECDDGNGSNNDACLATCKAAKCGDGQLYNGVEQCDDGNANNADGCSNACQKVAQLVGSYNVNSGPAWGGNPPTYTCKEACALLYGGQAGQYTCSVTNQAPTGQAYMSGYADGQYCTNPNSDNFKLNVNYNCGVFGCSYSAYVNDNCYQGTSINYCWKL